MISKTLNGFLRISAFALITFTAAQGAVVTFDNAITGQTSYNFDGDGDGVYDVVFSTTDPNGFNTMGPGPNMTYIQEPGLEGTTLLNPDLRVDFINGASGNLGFGFALSNGGSVTFNIYDSGNNLLGYSTVNGAYTPTASGTSSFPEGLVDVDFDGVASYATFDFSTGGRYIIDNFGGTFGSTEQIGGVPEPGTSALLGGAGLVLGVLRRRQQKKG